MSFLAADDYRAIYKKRGQDDLLPAPSPYIHRFLRPLLLEAEGGFHLLYICMAYKRGKEDPKECATLAMKESSSFPPTMLLLTLLFIFRWVLISVFLLLSFVLRLQRSGAVLHILEFQGKRDQQKAGGVFYRVP